MNDCDLETTYLDGPNGPLFCLNFLPARREKNFPEVIIHIPAFAEEMNKSRPMVSTQAKQMAGIGYQVVLFDLFGTGDSSGQFEEASWENWIRDLQFICEWAQEYFDADKLILWGLRAGCLLAGDFVQRQIKQVFRLLFWQPIVSGERVITQLRRLDQLSTPDKRSDLLQIGMDENEACVEIAGYELNADLIQEVSRAEFKNWHIPSDVRLDWLEVTALEGQKLGAASEQLLNSLRESSHHNIRTGVVKGEPFWFTQEVSMVPALLAETLKLLSNSNGKNPSADS